MKRIALILVVLAIGVLSIALIRAQQPPMVSAEVVGLRATDSAASFARADQVRPFMFPLDHGPHPAFQTEWWYHTGNLDAADGRHFGYQLTFFRRAVTPTETPRAWDWATNQVYFAHFAITDVRNNNH